jgi:hypothetical protein
MCVCIPTTAGLGLFFLSSFFLILIYTYYTKNSIDKHRSESQQKRLLFILLFRSLIIYSSAEKRTDNEVISMSLTVKSKPSLLLLMLSSSLLMNTWIEMNNLPERECELKIGENARLIIQEIEKEITHRSVSHCNNLWCCHFNVNHSNDNDHFCKQQPTRRSVCPSPSSLPLIQDFHY